MKKAFHANAKAIQNRIHYFKVRFLLCAATPMYSSLSTVILIDIHSLMLQLSFSVAKSIMGSCEHPWTYQMIKDDTSLFEQISEII